MNFRTETISLRTSRRQEIIDISNRISNVVKASGVRNGLVNLWTNHTTAALTINENDATLWEDILMAFTHLIPMDVDYKHNRKYSVFSGEQNAQAHVLSCLIKPDTTLSLRNGEIVLGTWQSILFIELDGPRSRSVSIQVMGE